MSSVELQENIYKVIETAYNMGSGDTWDRINDKVNVQVQVKQFEKWARLRASILAGFAENMHI